MAERLGVPTATARAGDERVETILHESGSCLAQAWDQARSIHAALHGPKPENPETQVERLPSGILELAMALRRDALMLRDALQAIASRL